MKEKDDEKQMPEQELLLKSDLINTVPPQQQQLKKDQNILNETNVQMANQMKTEKDLGGSMSADIVKNIGRKKELDQSRTNVKKNLPPEYDKAKLRALLDHQDRIVTDVSRLPVFDKRFADMRQQGNVKQTQREVDEINKILDWYANNELDQHAPEIQLNYTDEVYKALQMKKSFDLMHILVNEHSKGDSPEMKKVKIDVMKLAATLEAHKPYYAIVENLREISAMYETALASCADYLKAKNPKTKKGRKRYNIVKDVYMSLLFESAVVNQHVQDHKVEDDHKSVGQLLGMSRRRPADLRRVQVTGTILRKEFSSDAVFVQNIFKERYDFSAKLRARGISEKDRQDEAKKLLKFREVMRDFKPNQTAVHDVEIMGKKVRILQKADNSLYILENHERLPLDKSAKLVFDQIEKDMMKYPDAYGVAEVNGLLDEYGDPQRRLTTGEHLRIRQNLIEFLMDKLGKDRDFFNNIRRFDLVRYAKMFLPGSGVNGAKLTEQLKNELKNDLKLELITEETLMSDKADANKEDVNKEDANKEDTKKNETKLKDDKIAEPELIKLNESFVRIKNDESFVRIKNEDSFEIGEFGEEKPVEKPGEKEITRYAKFEDDEEIEKQKDEDSDDEDSEAPVKEKVKDADKKSQLDISYENELITSEEEQKRFKEIEERQRIRNQNDILSYNIHENVEEKKTEPLIGTGEQQNILENDILSVRQQVLKDINASVKPEDMINGVELTELMEIDALRMDEIEERVSMYGVQNAADQNDWSEEEKKVQNLLADFVYPEDTQIMDKNADHPEEFIRTVLLQNTSALAVLIKQIKDGNGDIITDVMKKMSLEKIFEGRQDNFASVISENVKAFCNHCADSFEEKDSVEQIASGLKSMLENKKDKEVTDLMKQLHAASETSVKKACNTLQEDVSELANDVFAELKDENTNTLKGIMKNAARSKNGQGKFTRTVFDNYFKSMPVLDQRAMLASVLRTSRKVEVPNMTYEQLIDDIHARNLKGYSEFYKGRQYYEKKLTDAEKQKLDEYRKTKEHTIMSANYLGGLIRGAGPLFQKMMQGLPEETLPKEIRLALRDVKSKLPPMPERVVKTQMNAIIERSGGIVKKIDVVKNLGAASVGQTFLCKLYGPSLPKEGRKVVIKLLRSDVQNRMFREEKVMLKCARDTDEGMEKTYKGQLEQYHKELDLINEMTNAKEGSTFYDGKEKGVEVEKINDIITHTTNSLVIEQADGKTLDDILLDADALKNRALEELSEKEMGKDGKLHSNGKIRRLPGDFAKQLELKNELIDKANDLIRKRDFMASASRLWVSEAMFGSGYYHADLHAGNIMISDEKATMIDFGNSAKLDVNQQKAITRMLAGAADQQKLDMNLFMEAFDSMLDKNDPDVAQIYTAEKKQQLRTEFEKILKMGNDKELGERISCALIRAQELGVPLSGTIVNFSQGQLRLQKSINDINNMISTLKNTIDWIDVRKDGTNSIDIISYVTNQIYRGNQNVIPDDFGAAIKPYIDMVNPVNKEEFINALLDDTYQEGDPEEGIETVDKRKEFDNKFLGSFQRFSDTLADSNLYNLTLKKPEDYEKEIPYEQDKLYLIDLDEEDEDKKLKPVTEYHRAKWEEFKVKYDQIQGNDEKALQAKDQLANDYTVFLAPMGTNANCFVPFGGNGFLFDNLREALFLKDENTVEAILKVYEQQMPLALEMERLILNLRNAQDRGKLSNAQKQQWTERIFELYQQLHEIQAQNNPIRKNLESILNNLSGEQPNNIKKQLEAARAEETLMDVIDEESGEQIQKKMGDVFNEKLDAYFRLATPHAYPGGTGLKLDTTPEKRLEINAAKKEVLDLHLKISEIQLKRFVTGRFDRKVDVKSYDFSKVMADVMSDNLGKITSYLGAGFFAAKAAEGIKEGVKDAGKKVMDGVKNLFKSPLAFFSNDDEDEEDKKEEKKEEKKEDKKEEKEENGGINFFRMLGFGGDDNDE